jgi:malate dehydrogenase (oxaloacetate-decarboxylating)(NADP+)
VIGPLLQGLSKPVQILPMNASVSDMINLAALAAHDAIDDEPESVVQAAE